MNYYTKIYQKITYNIVKEINNKKNDKNFTISIQPMFSMTNTSELNLDFLSDLDCFHPSLKAHQSMAITAWNNLFLNYKNKEAFKMQPILKCPDNNSLII